MSITDELREYVWQHMTNNQDLRAIADRIDAEHEAKISYWQGASYKDGYDEGYASADDWMAEHEDAMEEHGWVRLPVDADGVPWHINDEFEVDEGVAHVNGIGDNTLFYIDNDGMQWTRADNKRHYHVPTVEDVLREFAHEWWTIPRDADELLAKYAKRLKLEGEDE